MQTTSVFKLLSIIVIGLFFFAGTTLADGEWATGGANIFNTNTGNVGIGTTTGIFGKLEVAGLSVGFQANDYINGVQGNRLSFRMPTLDSNYVALQSYKTGANAYGDLILNHYGNVGIGTTSPSQKLDVNGFVNINNPTGPGSHPLNVGSTGGSNIRLTGRNNAGQDEAAIMFQKYDGSTFHGAIQGISGTMQILGGESGGGITVNSQGKVGIGSTSPNRNLSLFGNANTAFQIINSSTGTGASDGLMLQMVETVGYILNQENGALHIGTNNIERMTILANGNVGINTPNPEKTLDVNGSARLTESDSHRLYTANIQFAGSAGLKVRNNGGSQLAFWSNSDNSFKTEYATYLAATSGNVGIGTTNATKLLTLNKQTNGLTIGDGTILRLQSASAQYAFSEIGFNYHGASGSKDPVVIGYRNMTGFSGYTKGDFFIATRDVETDTSPLERLTVKTNGNVGIGTTNPQSTLAVNGTITTKKVKVTEVGWSDFVFADNYKLPSLAVVESHIKQYKHLPGIPSAKEIQKKGLDVSDVLAKQMQKIEELTLYMIEMKKENQEIQRENQGLKARIKALEER
ncbi:MAG: hypothetical protein EHM45_06865 [Desulfobacteraceae bacterium]|nr:MAG: hypothetical protein EHM45_06865 [Desulfobacteraceae bacterium]